MISRRKLLGITAQSAILSGSSLPSSFGSPVMQKPFGFVFNVRDFGAVGDGKTIDSFAINRAIEAASASGGGTIYFPAGTYASFSIRLKSFICLCLEPGATVVAALPDGRNGYDAPEPQENGEQFQDYGHNHWQNSLIWGDGIHDISIVGFGMIWGKGLSRGYEPHGDELDTKAPGAGNKTIALKNCHNVTLRDFSILKGGWFGVLATGVDNLTVDNLKIDTNRDGIDIDCCRNVRVSNCTVNSPWDDGICPKSSFALGYPRATENLTITNCYVTGSYEIGSVLDGTWKRMPASFNGTGRIKCGTESNGGFRNITISNCVFEHSRGFALETVDGATCEDITFSGITMRGCLNSPLFLRLGKRMRGPSGASVGTLKRVIVSNVSSSGAVQLPSILSGVPGYPIEDVKISDVYLHQIGGSTLAGEQVPLENAEEYPEPSMFGNLPATGFFFRHAHNLEISNVEIATDQPDSRPAFALIDVKNADFFRIRAPRTGISPPFSFDRVSDFRVLGSKSIADQEIP